MLVAKNISKRFSGVTALDNICLELHPGRVTAIIGENGAGKSTLMKIFSGVHTQYDGEIIYNGQTVRFNGTREAEAAGIAIIHQELNLVPFLSIAEKFFLGREMVNAFGVLDKQQMNEKARQLLADLNLDIQPQTNIAALKVGQQQLVEIARALYCNASVIIMDEPTSAISDREVDNLFAITRKLRAEGKTVVYISHKLRELFTIADDFIVFRDGRSVAAGEMAGVTQEDLIHKMTGRNINTEKSGKTVDGRPELLRAEHIYLRDPMGSDRKVLSDISFRLHKGEIVGIYG